MRHTGCVSSLSGNRSIDVFPSKETHFFGFIQFPSLLAQLCNLVAHPVGVRRKGRAHSFTLSPEQRALAQRSLSTVLGRKGRSMARVRDLATYPRAKRSMSFSTPCPPLRTWRNVSSSNPPQRCANAPKDRHNCTEPAAQQTAPPL